MNSPMENTMKLEEGKISVWYKDHERIITKRLQLPGTPRRAFPTRDDASGRDKKIKKKNLFTNGGWQDKETKNDAPRQNLQLSLALLPWLPLMISSFLYTLPVSRQ